MPECEMSGKQVPFTIKVRIEGVVMRVAPEYASLGVVLEKQPIGQVAATRGRSPQQRPVTAQKTIKEDVEYIVPDFGKKLKMAREAKGLKQEDFAKMIMEKASIIHQVESGHLRPDEKLCAKFKQYLGVDLVRHFHDEKEYKHHATQKMTLGDMMKHKL